MVVTCSTVRYFGTSVLAEEETDKTIDDAPSDNSPSKIRRGIFSCAQGHTCVCSFFFFPLAAWTRTPSPLPPALWRMFTMRAQALNTALSWDQINSRPGGGGKKVLYCNK